MTERRPLERRRGAVEELYAAHWRQLVRLAVLLVRDRHRRGGRAGRVRGDARSMGSRLRDHDKALAYLRQAVVNRSRSALRHQVVVDRHLRATAAAPTERRPMRRPARSPRPAATPYWMRLLAAARPAARGARAAALPRPVGGRDRRRAGHRPRLGQVARTRAAAAALRELLGDLEGRVMTDQRPRDLLRRGGRRRRAAATGWTRSAAETVAADVVRAGAGGPPAGPGSPSRRPW